MRTAFSTLFLSLALMAIGQTKPIEITLWPDGAPNSNGLKASDEVVGDQSFTMRVGEPILYVFPAENPTGPAVVMLPGGAYMGVAMAHEGTDMADWFSTQGITYAVLKYRMPCGNREVPMSDAEQAMRIMRDHAAEWGIDKNKVGVMGASAGGHLATTLATHYSSAETRPDFQLLYYPVVSMTDELTHEGSRTSLLGDNITDADKIKYSNELQVTSDTPKAFLMLSGDDDAVAPANSIRYYEALLKAGVKGSTIHVYPVGGHGWGFRDSFPYKNDWTNELRDWLEKEVIRTNLKNNG